MSPFAALLRSFRLQRNLRQVDLEKLTGYDQSYISALEAGLKGPPTFGFVNQLETALNLTTDEIEQLNSSFKASQRSIEISREAPEDIYLMLNELRNSLPHLTKPQINLIREIIKITPYLRQN